MFAFPPADRKAGSPATRARDDTTGADPCVAFGLTTLGWFLYEIVKELRRLAPKKRLPVLHATYSAPPGWRSGAMFGVVSQFSFPVVDAGGLTAGNCADGRANSSAMGAGSGSFRNSSSWPV